MPPQQTKSALVYTLLLRAAATGAIFGAWYLTEAWAANAPPPQIQFPGQVINPNINRVPINPAPRNPNQPNANQPNPNQPAPNNANQGQVGGGIRTATITFTGTGAPLTGAPTGARIMLRSPAITFTGMAAPLVDAPRATGTVTLRSPAITFTGTGAM